MAKTYTWIGPSGTAAAGTIAADWSPSGGPPAIGDTAIIGPNGTVLADDGPLKSNTIILTGGRLSFGGGTRVTSANPSIDRASLITTATTPDAVAFSTLDALANFVNQDTILAAGAAGSTLTINVGTSVFSGVTAAVFPFPGDVGYAWNPGVIQANAGNTLTIAIGPSSELLNTGSIVANGGTIRITACPSAIAGGTGRTDDIRDQSVRQSVRSRTGHARPELLGRATHQRGGGIGRGGAGDRQRRDGVRRDRGTEQDRRGAGLHEPDQRGRSRAIRAFVECVPDRRRNRAERCRWRIAE